MKLTAAEIAVVLGVTPATVRSWAHRHGIRASGKRGREALYDADRLLRHAKPHLLA